MIMDEAEKTAFLIHAAYFSIRFILFLVFLWYSIFSNSMFFRNVLCQLATLGIGCRLSFVGFPTSWPIINTLSTLTKNIGEFGYLFILDIRFFITSILVFGLLRFIFRVRGFGRNFWLPLGYMTSAYPFVILLYVLIMLTLHPDLPR